MQSQVVLVHGRMAKVHGLVSSKLALVQYLDNGQSDLLPVGSGKVC